MVSCFHSHSFSRSFPPLILLLFMSYTVLFLQFIITINHNRQNPFGEQNSSPIIALLPQSSHQKALLLPNPIAHLIRPGFQPGLAPLPTHTSIPKVNSPAPLHTISRSETLLIDPMIALLGLQSGMPCMMSVYTLNPPIPSSTPMSGHIWADVGACRCTFYHGLGKKYRPKSYLHPTNETMNQSLVRTIPRCS